MARGAVAGAVQEQPTADSQTPQLRPRPRGIPEPSGPGPRPPEPRCERTWQQNEQAGAGSWPLPPPSPPPPPRCSLRSAPGALGAACLADLLVAAGLFHSRRRAGKKGDPAAELVRALVACRGLCALLLTAEKTRERASPGLQRRGSGDEPDMERPPQGARSQPALRRGYRLSRGSAGLRVLGRPGEIPVTASGKDGSPAGRTLQQAPY